MSRRALSPAARGVLLAVSAALRGRVAAIDDAGDGTTHARVVEPDGTVLLDVRVRAVGRRDARQPALPLAPGPQHETPAPVAVLADARQPEASAQDDDAPEIHGVSAGDRITLDGYDLDVLAVDADGITWRDRDRPAVDGATLWCEMERVSIATWRTRPVGVETPAKQRAAKAPKVRTAKPARLVAVPEADALAVHGEVSIVGQQEPGGPWELAASGVRVPPETWTTARGAYHRLRQYARGGRCTRDSADEGGAP